MPEPGAPARPAPGPSAYRSEQRLALEGASQRPARARGPGRRGATSPTSSLTGERAANGLGPGPGKGRGGREGAGERAREGVNEGGSRGRAPSFPVLLLPPQRPSLARPPLAAVGGPGAPAARLARRGPRPKSPPLQGLIGQAQERSRAKGASGHVTGRGGDFTRSLSPERGRRSTVLPSVAS